MTTSTLPAPGLVHGVYPQRKNPPHGFRQQLRTIGLKLADQVSLKGSGYYLRRADHVLGLQQRYESLSDAALQEDARAIAAALSQHGLRHHRLLEAVAVAREVIRRETGLLAYRSQICATLVMLDHRLAEMHTGEGKTLATYMAALTAGIAAIPTHVITANDFLVSRDADGLRPIAARIGLEVGAIIEEMTPEQRREAYACHITYCTGKELVFDYLRDRLAAQDARHDLHRRLNRLSRSQTSARGVVLRGLCLALIDEADSILLDEATTPLILSQPRPGGMTEKHYQQALQIAARLDPELHFRTYHDTREIELTALGSNTVDQLCAKLPGLWRIARFRTDTVVQALRAVHLYARDRDYLVRDDAVHIIDPTTGRIAQGRQWAKGLHQFIELKEACPLSNAFAPMARITYQRFFPRYLQLGGTSATLHEARGELLSLYGLGVVRVPLHRASRRQQTAPQLFRNATHKWRAVIARARELHGRDIPVLIATESVDDSETLSAMLHAAGIPHVVLNARQDVEESRIVAGAGHPGSVTVATNMAGRGTDIKIDDKIAALGGLHVLSCQLNGSRRIERQLYGRCGRQGQPGKVEILLSLDEPLLQRQLSKRTLGWLRKAFARRATLPGWIASPLLGWVRQRHERHQKQLRKALQKLDEQNRKLLGMGGQE